MKRLLLDRRALERGATAVEYALVVGLVSLLVIVGPIGLANSFGEYCADLATRVGGLLHG